MGPLSAIYSYINSWLFYDEPSEPEQSPRIKDAYDERKTIFPKERSSLTPISS